MKFDNHILVIISIVSFFFIILVKGSEFSPSSSQENGISDEVEKAFGLVLDEAEETFGPISSLDLDKVEEAFSPSLDEAKDAFGPIPSLDEAKEVFGPVSSSILDQAKEALGPISPSALDEPKDAFGPASSQVLDKAQEEFDSITSWITQNKEDISSEAQKGHGPTPTLNLDKFKDTFGPISSLDEAEEAPAPISPSASSELLDEAKQKFGSIMSFITQNKEEISSLLEEAEKEFGPISSIDIDKAKEALPPISPSSLDEAKDLLNEAQKELGPISASDLDASSPTSSDLDEAIGSISSKTIDEAKEKLGSITSLISQNKEEISSDSPSILSKSQKELGPISSFDEDASIPGPTPSLVSAPVSPSTFDEAKQAIGSYSSKAIDAAKEKFGSISSLFSQNKMEISSESNVKLHSASVYFDHDVALAIESMIKQAQSNSQLATEEAKKLLSDTTIDSSDTRKCMKKCMDNYASCDHKLNKAMENLMDRNAELLTVDVGAVEAEIYVCQKCFLENTKKQSPLKDLEDATIKATRECLNVLDHSS